MVETEQFAKRSLLVLCLGLIVCGFLLSGCSLDTRSRASFEQAYQSREELRDLLQQESQNATRETGDTASLKQRFDESVGMNISSPDAHRENWLRANPLPSLKASEVAPLQTSEFSPRQLERLERIEQEIETAEKQLESAQRSLNTFRYYSHHTEGVD